MPQFMFDVLRSDGVAETWESAEMESDFAALRHAERVLGEHRSAVRVSVFEGERHVGDVRLRPRRGAQGHLQGCAVLVVEDQFLLAEDLQRLLHEAGAEVVGPFRDAPPALAAAEQGKLACAIVDINLGDGPNFDAAEGLLARDVPVLFVTGYDPEVLPPTLSKAPHLRKPAKGEDILAAVEALCARTPSRCA